jgi:DNA-binding response OmpR family regulator
MKPRKILVVESSKTMQKAYALMLRMHPLTYAQDAREALERLRQDDEIDLVLVDVQYVLELFFHLELTQDLERQPRTVIVLSYEGRDEDTVTALEKGAAAYIKKPFHAEELIDLIDRVEAPRRE